MASRSRKKSRVKQMKKKAKKLPVARNATLVRASERSCSAAGGVHKDRRQRRKNRQSWRKEYLED